MERHWDDIIGKAVLSGSLTFKEGLAVQAALLWSARTATEEFKEMYGKVSYTELMKHFNVPIEK